VLSGVTFKILPSNSGYLDCNGRKISNNDYVRYNIDTDITCKANANAGFIFSSWAGDLASNSTSDTKATFKVSSGDVTGYFISPSQVSLPSDFWIKLYSVMLSIIIPFTAGWSIPAIARWFSQNKQRKYMSMYMKKITSAQDISYQDRKDCFNHFEDIRKEIINILTQGKITESQYEILNNQISAYLEDLKE
jgi:hypothetical protein